MECSRTVDLLSGHLDGDLPEVEREGIAEHLRQCPRCAGEERALRETLSLLRNLPPVHAPPELLEGVRLRIGSERASAPLWKKLFLPAHIKIPLQTAAVVLIFLLAYGIQKEIPGTTPGAKPPAPAERGKPASGPGSGQRAVRQKASVPPERPAGAADRKVEEREALVTPREEATAAKEEATVPEPIPGRPTAHARSEIPAGLAARVSTEGRAIEPAFPREAPASRGFPGPLARLERPLSYGKEVTLEVSREDRIGMEDRIADIVLRLGGAVAWETTITVSGSSGKTTPVSEVVRVRVPADSTDAFLEELGKLGTIPAEEISGRTDTPAGPMPGTVSYTVRVRVR
jgi:anti-sigma factor RsiW